MAKKQRTTGGPRPQRATPAQAAAGRKKKFLIFDLPERSYQSRAERELRYQRRVRIGVAVMVAVSLLVLLGAVFYEQVIRPREAVTTVNGTKISTRDFENRVRFTRWQTAEEIRQLYGLSGGNLELIQQYAGTQLSNLQRPVLMGSQVLDQMEEELLIEQGAKELGIKVDNAAVDEQVNEFMGSIVGLSAPQRQTPTPSLTPTITVTPLVSPTPTNTPAPTLTPSPTETATPVPTNTPPAETPTEAPTVIPTETLVPSETPTEGPSATPTLSPTPTATLEPGQIVGTLEKAADNFYDEANDAVDVKREVVREVFYYEALRNAVLDELGKTVPNEELQVNARHMLFAFNPDNTSDPIPPTDEQKAAAKARADEALAALQAGEPFADLASALSNDTGSAAQGGELGWSNPEAYDPAFKDAVMNAEIGAIVGPIESQFGYHIIQVHGREVRGLSTDDWNTRRQEAYSTWLTALKDAAEIKRGDDWIDRVPEEPTYDSLLGDILPISQ
ncbi:MAG: peptidylprolyl isomerase [Chloroflexi bacterium]|nr:peptidylprolyl isomerase [Chloroflexota bacterium]